MKLTESYPEDRNIVGKGEIARNEQFSLFLQYFQRLVMQTCKYQELFWKELNSLPKDTPTKHQCCERIKPGASVDEQSQCDSI